MFENPDDDDVNWADSGRYAKEGHVNKRGEDRYRDIENTVFIELEDELLATRLRTLPWYRTVSKTEQATSRMTESRKPTTGFRLSSR